MHRCWYVPTTLDPTVLWHMPLTLSRAKDSLLVVDTWVSAVAGAVVDVGAGSHSTLHEREEQEPPENSWESFVAVIAVVGNDY